MPSSRSGQSIAEVLIAATVGVLLVGAAASLILSSLKGNTQATNAEQGSLLAKGMIDNARVFSEKNWNNLLALATGSTNTYFFQTALSPFAVASGTESVSYDSITSGLVGWWKFDDGYGSTTVDSSGNANTGTWNGSAAGSGGTYYTLGAVGQYAGDFDGSSNYVDAGNGSSLNITSGIFSISYWEKTSSTWVGAHSTGYGTAVTKGNGDFTNGGGQTGFIIGSPFNFGGTIQGVRFSVANGVGFDAVTGSASSTTGDGNWHFIVGIASTTQLSIYVDGVQVGTSTRAYPGNITTSNHLAIGDWTQYSRFFLGPIDDVRLYNRVLSTDDITQIYKDFYKRSFYLSDVYRNASGSIAGGGSYDPSTKEITVAYSWPGVASKTISTFLTRNENFTLDQTDWSGGAAANGTVETTTNSQFATSSNITYSTTTGSFQIATLAGSGGSSYNGYLHERTLTVTSTASVASGTLSNFPMLVSSTISSWESTSTAGGLGRIQNLCTAPNGSQEPCDLVFSTSFTCTFPLNFETESYTSSTGALVDWVNVPTMATGTVIYVCYDQGTVLTDQSHPSSTWDSNYMAVYHLSNGITLNASDSTSNAKNGISTSVTPVAGFINGAASFNGTNGHDITTSVTLPTTTFSYSFWASSGSTGLNNRPVGAADYIGGNTGSSVLWGYDGFSGNNNMYVVFRQGSNTGAGDIKSPAIANLTTASHYVVVEMSSSTGGSFYLDGALDGTNTTYTSITTGGLTFTIGQDANQNSGAFNGTVDEVRVSKTVRSSSWIATEYNNQSSPSTFYTVGNEL